MSETFGIPYVPTRVMAETHNWCAICESFTFKARCLDCGEKTYSPAAMSNNNESEKN